MEFIFANFGEKVFLGNWKGTITEFDSTPEFNTKVVFENGSFRWVNRITLENDMRKRELVLLDLAQEKEKVNTQKYV